MYLFGIYQAKKIKRSGMKLFDMLLAKKLSGGGGAGNTSNKVGTGQAGYMKLKS